MSILAQYFQVRAPIFECLAFYVITSHSFLLYSLFFSNICFNIRKKYDIDWVNVYCFLPFTPTYWPKASESDLSHDFSTNIYMIFKVSPGPYERLLDCWVRHTKWALIQIVDESGAETSRLWIMGILLWNCHRMLTLLQCWLYWSPIAVMSAPLYRVHTLLTL